MPCNCDEHLRLIELKVFEYARKINKDGTISKRKVKPYQSIIDPYFRDGEYLLCYKCEKEYEYLGTDKSGKVVKGKSYDE